MACLGRPAPLREVQRGRVARSASPSRLARRLRRPTKWALLLESCPRGRCWFFESGTIVSGRAEGLFLVKLSEEDAVEPLVQIDCTNCPVSTRAGQHRTASIAVANLSDVDQVYDVTVGGLPAGWTAKVRPNELAVEARGDEVATVKIRVPQGAAPGSYSVGVTATSTIDPAVSATDQIEVVVLS